MTVEQVARLTDAGIALLVTLNGLLLVWLHILQARHREKTQEKLDHIERHMCVNPEEHHHAT